MKKLFWLATAAIVLAGCSQNSEFEEAQKVKDLGTAIAFDTYAGKAPVVKAGYKNDLTTATLKEAEAGFGVFAYYTKTDNYNSTQKPDYMYDEKVTWDGSAWTYSPVKYWPNDNNPADNKGAEGTVTNSLVSFFAYGPYVEFDPTTGIAEGCTETGGVVKRGAVEETGITKVSIKNSETGDPVISYVLDKEESVDLLWGTRGKGTYTEADGTSNTVDITDGKQVNKDLAKQTKDEKVNFLFKHALAQIGGVKGGSASSGLQIIADVDALEGGTLASETVITLKSVTIEGTDAATLEAGGIVKNGTFNLVTGKWTLGTDMLDGFKHEVTTTTTDADGNLTMNEVLREPATVATGGTNLPTGVTTTAQDIYQSGAKVSPMVFLPGSQPKLKVTVEYVIRTKDSKVENGYSEASQKITKTIQLGAKIEVNKQYNLLLRLGLTSIKFEATVSDWEKGEYTDATGTHDNVPVHLPINVE